jgi:O-antigen/teichoic acid export membrane protein
MVVGTYLNSARWEWWLVIGYGAGICLLEGVLRLYGEEFNIFKVPAIKRINSTDSNFFNESKSFFVISLYQSVVRFGDAVVVGLLLAPSMLSMYVVASRLANIQNMALNAISTNYVKNFADLIRAGKFEKVKSVFWECMALLFLCVVMFLVVILLGRDFVNIAFNGIFQEHYWVVIVLCCSTSINVLGGPTGQLLSISGEQSYVEKTSRFLLVATVVVLPAVVYLWALKGAVVFNVLASLVRNGLYFLRFIKFLESRVKNDG